MSEIWKPVPEFEGFYEVSSLGRVRSFHTKKVKSPQKINSGYLIVHLYKNKKRKAFCVHYLVLLAFVGPRPIGAQCSHLDGNPKNNIVENIIYETAKENNARKKLHGSHLLGSSSPVSKLTEAQVRHIRRLRSTKSLNELAARFGTTFSNISAICLYKSWKHV